MEKKSNSKILYMLSFVTLACVYIPIIIMFTSDDVTNHNYDGAASNITEIVEKAGVVAAGLLLVMLIAFLKKLNFRPYMNVAKIFKFGFIPVYILGVAMIMFASVLFIVPVIGVMITASAWMAGVVIGYILLLVGTIPQIMAIKKASNEGSVPGLVATLLIIASFFFVLDVIVLIIFMLITKWKK